jgi:hypothetical protein
MLLNRLIFLSSLVLLQAPAQADPCDWLYARNAESALAAKVGTAVLYPTDRSHFASTFNCLSASYSQTTVSLAGFTWDITHSLLRMLAADPQQFMSLYASAPERERKRWRDSLESAALWPTDECPKPNPMQIASASLRAAKLPGELSTHRQTLVAALQQFPCRVAQ